MTFNASRWAIGFVGGMIGLLSLTLPWVTMGFEVGSQPVISIQVSPLDVYNWYSKAQQAGVQFPSGSNGQDFRDVTSNRWALGLLFMVVGGLILAISSMVSLGAPKAGYGMFAGSIMALTGSFMMLTNVSYFGMTAYISPGTGVFLAVVASIISIAGSRTGHETKRTGPASHVYAMSPPGGFYSPVLPPVSAVHRAASERSASSQATLQEHVEPIQPEPATHIQRTVEVVSRSQPKPRATTRSRA